MMGEMMSFPETWEEFEKQYGFYDSKQAYMFGNTRLIPSFRVEQWLDHIDNVKRKKQLQKNKMEQIAAMFGKKLGEEFLLKTDKNAVFDFMFDDEGFWYMIEHRKAINDHQMLLNLLTGKAMIVDENT